MTFTELMSILNGEYKETAGTTAKNQCVDLANAYIKHVLGFPIIEYTNAKDFPSKAGDKYEYILNTPTGVPHEGDLVIWGGTYGHISIFIEGDQNRFSSFDENWPTGSPCHVQEHNYDNVLGWLRCKEPQSQSQWLQNSDNWIALITECGLSNNKDAAIAEVNRRTELSDKVEDKDRELGIRDKKIEELEKKLKELTINNESITEQLDKITQTNINQRTEITEATDEIKKLKKIKPIGDYSVAELIGKIFDKFFAK